MLVQKPLMRRYLPAQAGFLNSRASLAIGVIFAVLGLAALTSGTLPPLLIASPSAPSPADLQGPSETGKLRLGSNGIPQMTDPENMECESGQCRKGCFNRRSGMPSSKSELDSSRRLRWPFKRRHSATTSLGPSGITMDLGQRSQAIT